MKKLKYAAGVLTRHCVKIHA